MYHSGQLFGLNTGTPIREHQPDKVAWILYFSPPHASFHIIWENCDVGRGRWMRRQDMECGLQASAGNGGIDQGLWVCTQKEACRWSRAFNLATEVSSRSEWGFTGRIQRGELMQWLDRRLWGIHIALANRGFLSLLFLPINWQWPGQEDNGWRRERRWRGGYSLVCGRLC